MTGLIVVDESGDTGKKGSVHFTICSIISPSSRTLLPASRNLPKANIEKKFYNTADSGILDVLNSLSDLPIDIAYVSTEKNHPSDGIYTYNNELYRRSLKDLLDLSLPILKCKDVNIIIDGNRYITQKELREMCEELCLKHNKNLKKCYKGISQNEPCIRIVDYVAGSIQSKFEREESQFASIIERKVSVARRY